MDVSRLDAADLPDEATAASVGRLTTPGGLRGRVDALLAVTASGKADVLVIEDRDLLRHLARSPCGCAVWRFNRPFRNHPSFRTLQLSQGKGRSICAGYIALRLENRFPPRTEESNPEHYQALGSRHARLLQLGKAEPSAIRRPELSPRPRHAALDQHRREPEPLDRRRSRRQDGVGAHHLEGRGVIAPLDQGDPRASLRKQSRRGAARNARASRSG